MERAVGFHLPEDDAVAMEEILAALPSQDLMMEETKKFVAFGEISNWKEKRVESNFAHDSDHLKMIARFTSCRADKVAHFQLEHLLILMDELEERFQECLKIARISLKENSVEVKIEAEVTEEAVSFDVQPNDFSPVSNSHHESDHRLLSPVDDQLEPSALEAPTQSPVRSNEKLFLQTKKRRGRRRKLELQLQQRQIVAAASRPRRRRKVTPKIEASADEALDDLVCRICGEAFADKTKLHKHVWKHNRQKSHICDICGKGFWMKYLLTEHRYTHTGEKPYICSICGAAFGQMQSFNAHKRAHRFETNLKTKEPSADPSSDGLIGGNSSISEPSAAVEPSSNSASGGPSLTCRFCDRKCKTLRTLANHENIHTGGISKNSYKYFMEVKEKEFHGVKKHSCEICNESFAYRNSLTYHKRKSHRLFVCVKCGKAYNCSQALNNHLRAHVGEKNFECVECHKKYLHQTGLLKHMEIHEGKTFVCDVCNKTFTRIAYLRKHQVMHGDQDKYAEVKMKRAANCRKQRSGMTDEEKETYKRTRREYMRDWLAKKRKTTAPRAPALTMPPTTTTTTLSLTADFKAIDSGQPASVVSVKRLTVEPTTQTVAPSPVSMTSNTVLPIHSLMKAPLISGPLPEAAVMMNTSLATIVEAGGGVDDLKPLTLTIPSNISVSLAVPDNLQTTMNNLGNPVQIPANVLPIALSNGTITNVPISITNALFSNSLATSIASSL